MSDTVSASHILVGSLNEAVEVRNAILSGSEFGDLAKTHSKCPSGQNGGSLGSFPRGMMVPEFETAAFGLNVGEVSEPVQTGFGYHIIHRTG